MTMPTITAEQLRTLLHYDPETGVFTRKVRTNNCVQVGDVVGTPHSRGYVFVSVGGTKYLAHRLAWLYVTGEWPADEIDHRDGDKHNNRWSNLREATNAQNKQNIQRATAQNQSTGLLGASYCRGAYQAHIRVNGKPVYLGRFSTPQEAHEAYLQAKRLHHPFNTI